MVQRTRKDTKGNAMMVRKTDDRTLQIDRATVRLEKRIQEFMTVKDRVLVMLNISDFPDDDPEAGRNIFAFDRTGRQLWRIEDAGYTALSSRDHKTEVPQGYTGMSLRPDGRVRVFQPIGCYFFVDLETGAISDMEIVR